MEVIFSLIFLLSMTHAQKVKEIDFTPSTKLSSASADLTSTEIRNRSATFFEPRDDPSEDRVSSVLRLIESQRKNCTPGTELNLVGVVDQYGVKKFSGEAKIALNRANLLTRLWKHSSGIFYATDPIIRNQTEYLLYAAVRTMVELNENIYSAGNCYDWFRYPHYPLFCPFATRMPQGDEIQTKDLSIAYEYDDSMEWFGTPKAKGETAIKRSLMLGTTQIKKAKLCRADTGKVVVFPSITDPYLCHAFATQYPINFALKQDPKIEQNQNPEVEDASAVQAEFKSRTEEKPSLDRDTYVSEKTMLDRDDWKEIGTD